MLVDYYGLNPDPPYASGITVFVKRTEYTAQVDTAWEAWNSAWGESDATPVFSTTSGTDTIEVEFFGTGSYFCGAGWERYIAIDRQESPTPPCEGGRPGEPYSDLMNLIKHEFGHGVGYNSLDSWPVGTEGCVMNVPASGNPLNNDFCNHEKQLAFWRYGERDTLDLNSPMIYYVGDLMVEDSVLVDSTTWAELSYEQYPESPTVLPSELPVWSVDDTTIAVIVDQDGMSAEIRGVSPGSTTLRVEVGPDLHVVWQESGPFTDQATITVYGLEEGPEACFTLESHSTWIYTDQILNASCSDQGGNIGYSWRFASTGGWTSPSSDTVYDFEGHSSAGASKPVQLKVTDISTGDSTIVADYIDVANDQMTVNGEMAIQVKSTYQYDTDGDSAYWYEQYPPSTDWDDNGSGYTDLINRIWPAGEYEVYLRAEDRVSGELRRGRLPITVCTVTQSCSGARSVFRPPHRHGSLFGGGPILTWTSANGPEALQFYQLMGAHTVPSPFGSNSWFDLEGGSVRNAPWPGDVSWKRGESGGIVTYEFDVDPPTAGEYVFGFAVDPDLGEDVADDIGGYDAASGMAYVSDGSEAMGFLLRAGGRNELAAVVQYGTGRFAPASAEATWKAVRQGGIDLLPGERDVQFVLAASARIGKGSFTVAVLEADDVAALIAMARAIK